MDRIADYLCIPPDYADRLGGLRWAESGEAVEYRGGEVFAFRQQVALFLDGLATGGRLIHFAHVLHLLHLLGVGKQPPGPKFMPLAEALLAARRPLRNAGVLCARLCGLVAPVAEEIDTGALSERLNNSFAMWQMCSPAALRERSPRAELPLYTPEAFETLVADTLGRLDADTLFHWLCHGRGPLGDAGEKVARELAAKPPSLSEVLAAVARRERLAGALPHVAQLLSALALPPRRLAHQELPVGGYADVATRGHPEQILPSQFALDGLEFLRRFAQHELLYFRREEPHAQTREELVLLLDQGVRTWGDVRLLLTAAVFAFGKLAARRGIDFRVAATGSSAPSANPVEVGDRAIADLLEASDLSPNPGLALERVLEEPAESARDVVLLTHPRNLREPDVATAARRLLPGTRLFAVAADAAGEVQLVELRRGVPVQLGRFRVDLSAAPSPPPRPEPDAPRRWSGWTGAVEPVGYPFRFGIGSPLHYFDFDAAGEWLMAVSHHGLLHLFKADGAHVEAVPRGMVSGAVVSEPRQVLGVAGGFVVCGRVGAEQVVLHYDLASRSCTLHRLGTATQNWLWYYYRQHHAIVATGPEGCRGVDLATGAVHSCATSPSADETVLDVGAFELPSPPAEGRKSLRALHACRLAQQGVRPTPFVGIFSGNRPDPPHARWVRLDQDTGTVRSSGFTPPWPPFTPLADGKPLLRDCYLLMARHHDNKLGLIAGRSAQPGAMGLHVFRGPEGVPVFEYWPYNSLPGGFALSADGRLLAYQMRANQLGVRDLDRGGLISLTLRGRFHNNVSVTLGEQWLLIQVRAFEHLVRWDGDELTLERDSDAIRAFFRNSLAGASRAPSATHARPADLPSALRHDPQRFRRVARARILVVVDEYGQIAAFDLAGELLCMFFVFRSQFAAWMPDGTCYGPPELTGRPSTPEALRKLGQALRAASHWGVVR